MEYPDGLQIDDIDRFADHRFDESPPEQVIRALFSVTAGEVIKHGHGRLVVKDDPQKSEWHLLALTDSRFITVMATAAKAFWTWRNSSLGDVSPDILARAESRADVHAVEVTSTRLVRVDHGGTKWAADYTVRIGDRTVDLPRATESRRPAEREVLEAIAISLLRQL